MGIDPEWVYERRKKIEKLIGYRPEEFLGDGSYGVVFTTNRRNMALKVTSHKTEAKTLALIMCLRKKGIELPGIVKVKSLVHFAASCQNISNYDSIIYDTFATPWVSSPFDKRKVNIFFIVRELLQPALPGAFRKSLNPYITIPITARKKAHYERKVRHVFGKFPQVKDTVLTLAKYGIFLWDLRPSNAGMSRGGQLVIHDVVAARPLPEVIVPSLGTIR